MTSNFLNSGGCADMKEWKGDLEYFKWGLNVPIIVVAGSYEMPVHIFRCEGNGVDIRKIAVLNDGSNGILDIDVCYN